MVEKRGLNNGGGEGAGVDDGSDTEEVQPQTVPLNRPISSVEGSDVSN